MARRSIGFHWRATDAAWERGDGSVVAGPMVAIVCALMGRPAAYESLDGPGVADARRLTAAG